MLHGIGQYNAARSNTLATKLGCSFYIINIISPFYIPLMYIPSVLLADTWSSILPYMYTPLHVSALAIIVHVVKP